MELVLFTLNAVVVYLLSDWILRAIEARHGEPLPKRHIVFFVIFGVLILVSFSLLRNLGP
jgi:surface polysaccharide O-acyltransferase-like enzyme